MSEKTLRPDQKKERESLERCLTQDSTLRTVLDAVFSARALIEKNASDRSAQDHSIKVGLSEKPNYGHLFAQYQDGFAIVSRDSNNRSEISLYTFFRDKEERSIEIKHALYFE